MNTEKLKQLAFDAQCVVDTVALEETICTQEDASLRSPGVPAHYYRFLYRIVQLIKPAVSLELGTHTGISAACMAEGNPEGKVITVNNRSELMERCRRANVEYVQRDSLQKVELPGPIDILFIDTDHDGVRCLKEYELYINDVRPGGIIFFDDILLNTPMKNFWSAFNPKEGEKIELPVHGWAGFGAVIKRGP